LETAHGEGKGQEKAFKQGNTGSDNGMVERDSENEKTKKEKKGYWGGVKGPLKRLKKTNKNLTNNTGKVL